MANFINNFPKLRRLTFDSILHSIKKSQIRFVFKDKINRLICTITNVF